jgi:hypothetical protein
VDDQGPRGTGLALGLGGIVALFALVTIAILHGRGSADPDPETAPVAATSPTTSQTPTPTRTAATSPTVTPLTSSRAPSNSPTPSARPSDKAIPQPSPALVNVPVYFEVIAGQTGQGPFTLSTIKVTVDAPGGLVMPWAGELNGAGTWAVTRFGVHKWPVTLTVSTDPADASQPGVTVPDVTCYIIVRGVTLSSDGGTGAATCRAVVP